MKSFLRTRLGLGCVAAFAALMAVMFHRVSSNRRARESAAAVANPSPRPATPHAAAQTKTPSGMLDAPSRALAESVASLDAYGEFDRRIHEDRDRQGNPITRRANPGRPSAAGQVTEMTEPAAPATPPLPSRAVLRLHGAAPRSVSTPSLAAAAADPEPPSAPATVAPAPARPRRFNPYGSIVKCELVFTLDSTNEETPLIGIVMEPTYNNGQLIIPVGTELHGTARPDRLRDRIFSGQDWILVFPRESGRLNGRQLNVRGVALDRVEPQANGLTWGLTDGSYGLEGQVIRTMRTQEIERFVATFLGAAAETLEQRESTRSHGDTIRNTPQNAVLQGLAANLGEMAKEISDEIAKHGVFIRVPAGHQFYFYPMQIIDPDAADISSDIAGVK